MLHRFIDNPDYKSRFRILKGGKISLVVSALLVSSSVMLNAGTTTISDANTSQQSFDGNTTSLDITSTGSVTTPNGVTSISTTANLENNNLINIDGNISVNNGFSAVKINGSIENGSHITNSGNIQATADGNNYTRGIHVVNDMNGTITNNAGAIISIESIDSGRVFGIEFNGDMQINSSLVNSGMITAISAGDRAFGVYVANNMYGRITNNTGAKISAEGASSIAYGVYFKNGMKTNSLLTNSGIIKATNNVHSYSVYVNSNMDGEIINNSGALISAESNVGKATSIYFKNGIEANSSLVNSGTIKATSVTNVSTGVYTGTINGSIVNNTGATISAETNSTSTGIRAMGVFFGRGMEANSSLVNSGIIKANSINGRAIAIQMNGSMYGTITNDAVATISAVTTNGTAHAILLGKMKTDSLLENSGTIEVESIHESDGVYAYGMFTNSKIINSGTITVESQSNAHGIRLYYDTNAVMSNNASIINNNTISVSSTIANAFGIYLEEGGMEDSASIINNGTIDVSSKNRASGIRIGGNVFGTITNNAGATISVESNSSTAFGIRFDYGMEINSTLVNSGTITVNSISSRAYGAYFSQNMDGNITNSGDINVTVNGASDKSAFFIHDDSGTNTGEITNTSSGKLYGNVKVFGSGLFTNSGLISLPYNANGATSAEIDNFTQTATGILQIGLNTASDGNVTNNYSQLKTKNATFADGSTIDVNVLTASGNQDVLIGTTLSNVVQTDSNLTINGTLNITDNSALLTFIYTSNGSNISLEATGGSSIEDSVISGGGSSSTQKAGAILGNGDPAFNGVVGELNALATDKEVARAVESTTSTVGVSNIGASTQLANAVRGIINSRQNTMSGSGLNSGEALLSDKNVWIKPYVSFGSQNDKDGISGFDLKATGFGLGIDGEYDTKQRIGVAFFYTNARVNTNNVSQNSDLDIFNLLVYGSTPLIDDKTTFLYQAGYGRQSTSSTRDIFNSTQATADYTTQTASLDLQLMRNFQVNDNFVVEPTIGTTYRYTNTPSYTESGAGVLNLSTDKFTANDFTANAGVLTNYKASKDIYLLANANLRYDLNNQTATVTSAYTGSTGSTFNTNGIDNGRLNYELGLGVNMQEVLGGEISFMYDYQAKGSDFSNNIFSARYLVRF